MALPKGGRISIDALELKRIVSLRKISPVWQMAQTTDRTINPETGRKRVVLVAGPPGAGKGTLCDRIATHTNSQPTRKEAASMSETMGLWNRQDHHRGSSL